MNQANFSNSKFSPPVKQGSVSKVPHLCKTNKSTFSVSQHDSRRLFPARQRKHGQAKWGSVWLR